MARFSKENSKKGFLAFRHEIHLSKGLSPKTPEQKELMSEKPYASVVGSLMYVMLCNVRDICYAVGIVSHTNHIPK